MAHPYYYLNLCGMKLSDDQLQQMPLARLELATHVTLKTTQSCGLIGAAVVAPICSLIKGQRSQMLQNQVEFGKKGIITGMALGPALTTLFCAAVRPSYDGVQDRCYRIRVNKKQLLVDRMSILGIIGGIGAAHLSQYSLTDGAAAGYITGFFLGSCASAFL